jgi:hypothetical protein
VASIMGCCGFSRPAICRASGVVLSLLLCTPQRALARAGDAADAMARAIDAEEALEYEQARELWLEVIARDDLSAEQRVEANIHAGSVARILDRDVEARSHFVNVLAQQPDYQLPPATPPKVHHFFELIRQELRSSAALGVDRRPPAAARAAAEPVVAPGEDTADTPNPLLWAGAGSVGLGLLAGLLGVTAGALSSAEQQQAMATEVQLERVAHYQTRDGLVVAANVGYGSAALLAIAGLSLTTAALLQEPP